MKKFLYMAVAAIAALSSCSSDDIVSNENGNNANAPVFTATIEGESVTRTQLVEGSTAGKLTKVAWLNTDKVFIYGPGSSALSVVGDYNVSPNAADATSATLTPGTLRYYDSEVEMSLAHAFYPASISRINIENIDVATMYANKLQRLMLLQKANQYYLPEIQQYNGTNISQIAPMYGVFNKDENNFTFINLTAFLAITVPATECSSVQEIVISSDQRICGYYQINGDNTIAPVTDETTIKSVTLDCTNNGANTTIASGESKTFYISIPANTYGYLQIDVTDGVNTKTMKTKAASIEVERNKIYPIAFADNSAPATTGTAKATINGNEVDVEWVQLWADGPKFATQNVASKMIWADAIKTGSNFVWGANWRCPSKDEMAGLQESGNATCNLCNVNGNWFFKFTGVQEGYKSNVIYFPVSSYTKEEEDGEEYEDANGYYWTSAEQNDEYGYALSIMYADGSYATLFAPLLKSLDRPVRPVLNK